MDTPKVYDSLNAIIAYEQDELNNDDVLELFSHLIKSGLAWQLQGCYGRQAKALIDAGYIDRNGKITREDI
jgi:hypothetical protein